MSEIKLFSIGNQVNELVSNEVILEKELQNLIEKNMETFFGVRFLKSEYAITNGRMDTSFNTNYVFISIHGIDSIHFFTCQFEFKTDILLIYLVVLCQ